LAVIWPIEVGSWPLWPLVGRSWPI
jgi:hypothetical protein